jgi:SLT domain-containing protein
VFSSSQQMFDAMRNSNALGSTASFNQVVKDTVANLVPLAGGNKAAAAEISALAQEAGGPATLNLKSLAQWAGNQGAAGAAADLYKQQQLAVTSTYNLSQDAQALGNTLQQDLVPNMASAVGKAAGVPAAMQAMANSFTSGGATITKAMTTTVGGMFTSLLKQGTTPANAKSIIDGWIQKMDPKLSNQQIASFWNGLSPSSSPAQQALHSTQTLFNRQRDEIAKPVYIPIHANAADANTRKLMSGGFFGKKILDLSVVTAKNNPAFALGALFIGTKVIKIGTSLIGAAWSKILGMFGGGTVKVTASAEMLSAANIQLEASLNMLRAAGLQDTAATGMAADATAMDGAGAVMGKGALGALSAGSAGLGAMIGLSVAATIGTYLAEKQFNNMFQQGVASANPISLSGSAKQSTAQLATQGAIAAGATGQNLSSKLSVNMKSLDSYLKTIGYTQSSIAALNKLVIKPRTSVGQVDALISKLGGTSQDMYGVNKLLIKPKSDVSNINAVLKKINLTPPQIAAVNKLKLKPGMDSTSVDAMLKKIGLTPPEIAAVNKLILKPKVDASGITTVQNDVNNLLKSLGYVGAAIKAGATPFNTQQAGGVKPIPHKAAGGLAQGWAVVGEKGPELAYFGGQGASIVPANVTSQVMSGIKGYAAGTGNYAAVAGMNPGGPAVAEALNKSAQDVKSKYTVPVEKTLSTHAVWLKSNFGASQKTFFTQTVPSTVLDVAASNASKRLTLPIQKTLTDHLSWQTGTFGAGLKTLYTQSIPSTYDTSSGATVSRFDKPVRSTMSGHLTWQTGTFLAGMQKIYVTQIPAAFSQSVTNVGTTWNGINQAVKAPINTVDTGVISKGLFGAFNQIEKFIGSKTTLAPIPAFTRGGKLPGFGGGDIKLALLEPGEVVVDKFRARKHAGVLGLMGVPGMPIGPAGDRNPLAPGNRHGILRMANGGAIAADAEQYVGHVYHYGGPSNPTTGWDCSSFADYIYGHDFGLMLPGGSWASTTANGSGHGPATPAWPGFWPSSGTNPASATAGQMVLWKSHMGIARGADSMVSAYDTASGTINTSISGGGPSGEALIGLFNPTGVGTGSGTPGPASKGGGGGAPVNPFAGLGKLSAFATDLTGGSSGKALGDLMSFVGAKPSGASGQFGSMLNAVPNAIAKMALPALKSQITKWQGTSGASGGSFLGSGSGNYAADITTVLKAMGLPLSLVPNWLSQIQTESGGNLNAVNLTDSNAQAGHPSVGLLQLIPATFAAYAGPYINTPPLSAYGGGPVSEDPMAQIYAAIHYAAATYGGAAMGSVIGHGHGYAGGTGGAEPGWAWVGERGKELVRFHGGEQVLSNGDSMKVGSSIGRGFASGTSHGTTHGSSKVGDWNKQIRAWELLEQVEFAKMAADKVALSKLEKQIPVTTSKEIATSTGVINREMARIAKIEKSKPKDWRKDVATSEGVIAKEKARIAKLTAGEPVKIRKAIAEFSSREAAALRKIASLKKDINKDKTLIDEWQDRFDVGTGAAAPAGNWVGKGADHGEWLSAGGVFGKQLHQGSDRNQQTQTTLLSRIAAAAESAPAKTGQHVSAALNSTAGAASSRSKYNTQVGY